MPDGTLSLQHEILFGIVEPGPILLPHFRFLLPVHLILLSEKCIYLKTIYKEVGRRLLEEL